MKQKFRQLHPGMGQAVAERTILRKKENGRWETWGDVAHRVALGNSLLCKEKEEQEAEYKILNKHIANASLLMSGRHLQHGDETQPTRNLEIFVNCATSATSFALFYLLLNGAGVGRCYDDDIVIVNWDNAPNVRCVLSETHPDFDWSAHESARDARHKYGNSEDNFWFEVPDSREGWAKALEIWENSAFEKIHKDKILVLDFSNVREKGRLIGGMQNRPASGPVPLMNAFQKAASLKGAGLSNWEQAMYLDHYFAECVLVGGARRSARMSTKHWKDKTIADFILVKRPIEYKNKSMNEIIDMRKAARKPLQGFLWSSNNSVCVDEDFWNQVSLTDKDDGFNSPLAQHARMVLKLTTEASYGDGTGEPGLINQDKLVRNNSGLSDLTKGDFIGSSKYQIEDDTSIYLSRLAKKAKAKKLYMIVNPCSEITIHLLGGYCTIADVVPYFANTLDEAEEAFRAATRALIRVNTLDSLYAKEVKRTNRIGVGITGIHEFAWKFFGLAFRDLIDEEVSKDFWATINRFNRAVYDEAVSYSRKLGVVTPHTMTTIKPAGTTSKLFGLTEGWHLSALAWYLRWVQFTEDSPLVKTYIKAGYPYQKLKKYQGTVIIGFPTQPIIAELGLGDKLVTAGEATPEEQYRWLMLGEKYWIDGVSEDGQANKDKYGNQISYTLKYNPEVVGFEEFSSMLTKYQRQVKCCAVMPQTDLSAYEYQPEQSITKAEYEAIANAIQQQVDEDIGKEHLDCLTGACPVDFNSDAK